MIDLFYPYVPPEAGAAVVDVLRTRWIGQGPKVDEFEKKFSDKFGVAHVVSVNSGTAALETAYDLIGLKKGDEVITTPLTCTATNLPLLQRGVKIVWADILEDTLCIDPLDVRSKMTRKTKAVVQVHLGGVMSDVGKMHVPVVSDAAQAPGIFNGDYTCLSFQAIKHFTTGDGGLIVCPDEASARKAKLMRWFGIDREKKIAENWQAYKERKMTFDIEVLGSKRHMNDISAALGIVGLNHYEDIMIHRKYLYEIYKNQLKDMGEIKIIGGQQNQCWLMTILVKRRDDFAKKMFEAGIDTNVVQVRNDIYKIFGGKRVKLPTLNRIEEEYISLPLGMHVSEEDVQYICDTIRKGW